MKEYNLIAFGKRIPVDEATYKTYYQAYEKERYQNHCYLAHTLSLEKLEESGLPLEDHLLKKTKSTEALLEERDLKQALEAALNTLSEEERARFLALAYGEATERELALRYKMSKSSIHREKVRIAKKFRDYLASYL